MKIDLEKANKYVKEFKEDMQTAISELMDDVFVEDINDDLTVEEVVIKEDANKSKGKPAIHQTIQRCYYSIRLAMLNKKLEKQEMMKENIEPKQEEAIAKIEKQAEKNGVDLLSEQVVDDKTAVYQNTQEQIGKIDSAIEQTKEEIQNYEQKIEAIDNSVLNQADTDLLNQASTLEPIDNTQIEQQLVNETAQQMKEDVQAMTSEVAVEPITVENKMPSIEEERNNKIEEIVASLHTEIEGIYKELNKKIENAYQRLNDEVTSSYEQITNKTESAMKKLEQFKEENRKDDIKAISDESEKAIRSVGEKLTNAEARQKETDANLQKAEDTIVTQNNNIQDMQEQISNLNENVSTKDKEIAALNDTVAAQNNEIERLKVFEERFYALQKALNPISEQPEQEIRQNRL